MQSLNPNLDVAQVLNEAARAQQRLLLLDYDGTLASFQQDPAQARPYQNLPALLDWMAERGSRIVVVTGRPADQCLHLLCVRQPVEIWGCHGGERRMPDGSHRRRSLSGLQAAGLARAKAIEGAVQSLGGRMECKPFSVAVHHRGCQEQSASAIRQLVLEDWQEVARISDLTIHEFDGGLELRPPGINKARAVETLLSETGAQLPAAYLGDDDTDEDGFRAIHGRGLGVLVRPELRTTAADLWIKPPEELFWFLMRWGGLGD